MRATAHACVESQLGLSGGKGEEDREMLAEEEGEDDGEDEGERVTEEEVEGTM